MSLKAIILMSCLFYISCAQTYQINSVPTSVPYSFNERYDVLLDHYKAVCHSDQSQQDSDDKEKIKAYVILTYEKSCISVSSPFACDLSLSKWSNQVKAWFGNQFDVQIDFQNNLKKQGKYNAWYADVESNINLPRTEESKLYIYLPKECELLSNQQMMMASHHQKSNHQKSNHQDSFEELKQSQDDATSSTPEPTPEPAQPNPEPTQPNPEPTQPNPEPTQPNPEPTQPNPEPTQPEPTQPAPTQTPEQNQPSKKVEETEEERF